MGPCCFEIHYRGWNASTVNHSYNWHDTTSDHSPTPIRPQFHGAFTMSEMVARLLKKGVHQSEVARQVGVHRQSVSRWAASLDEKDRAGLKQAALDASPG